MSSAAAQSVEPPGTLEIVIDASGSMRSRVGRSERMTLAREFVVALREALEEEGGAPPLALRAYGSESHRLRRDCTDSRLLAGVEDGPEAFGRALLDLQPLGVSPLAYALERAAADTATTYVLITDGADNCGGDACRAWREAVGRAGDNRSLRLHVVAIEADPGEVDRLRCLSRAGSGSYLQIASANDVEPVARRLALVLKNRGRIEVRLSVGEGEAFSAPVRLLKPLTGEVVAALPERRSRAVPAGSYTVVIETAPPVRVDRVMVFPGQTVTLARSDFGRLVVDLAEPDRRAPVSIRSPGQRAELRYVRTGDTTILGAGVYDIEVDLGDSVVVREALEVERGRTTRFVVGGTEPGTLLVEVPGFEDPPDVRVLAYHAESVDTLAVGRPARVAPGRYRLIVQTVPAYVAENVVVDAGRETVVALPRTGVLGVELHDGDGPIPGVPVEVAEPMTGERYGIFTSGERVMTIPGTFHLRVRTAPPVEIDDVTVQAGEARVVERRGFSRIVVSPGATPGTPPLRLEVLSAEGGRLAEAIGPRPWVAARPGEYRARLWRDQTLLWEDPVTVAPEKTTRIDWAGPQ